MMNVVTTLNMIRAIQSFPKCEDFSQGEAQALIQTLFASMGMTPISLEVNQGVLNAGAEELAFLKTNETNESRVVGLVFAAMINKLIEQQFTEIESPRNKSSAGRTTH